jgi:hypothetical protein
MDTSNDDLTDWAEAVRTLKTLLISASRGEANTPEHELIYTTLRDELLHSRMVRQYLPNWLREYRSLREFWPFIKTKSPSYAGRLEFLRKEFNVALEHAEQNSDETTSESQRFFPAGTDHDAFIAIRRIVESVQSEILIVDPYVDSTLWVLLTNLSKRATVRIVTMSMKGDFILEAKKFAKQHQCTVEIRRNETFHDRFVVVDNAGCWHFGASIKDAGAKAFLMSQLQSEPILKATLAVIENEWQQSVAVL